MGIINMCLYCIQKTAVFFGLAPFKVLSDPPYIKVSKGSAFYSYVYTIFMFFLLLLCNVNYFNVELTGPYGHATTIFVGTIIVITSTCRTMSIYILQIKNRYVIMKILIDARRIYANIQNLNTDQNGVSKKFLDSKCLRLAKWKIMAVFIQVFIIIVSFYLYKDFFRGQYKYQLYLKCTQTIFTDGISIIFSSIFFCLMLFALQSFRHLNNNLKCAMNSLISPLLDNNSKVQLHVDVCNTIHQLEYLYGKIVQYIEMVNDRASVPLLMILLQSFVYALARVCFSKTIFM